MARDDYPSPTNIRSIVRIKGPATAKQLQERLEPRLRELEEKLRLQGTDLFARGDEVLIQVDTIDGVKVFPPPPPPAKPNKK